MANTKPISRAGQFADRIEALGYTVQRKKINRHEKQVLATLKDITIIATWVDDEFVSPVIFVQGERTDKIRKTKDARLHAMALAAKALSVSEPPSKTTKIKAGKKTTKVKLTAKAADPEPKPAPPVVSRPSDEPPETDEEYIAKVRGATILWKLVGKDRKTRIPKDAKHLKIDYSGSLGRRCLTFCDDDGFHTRPLSEITII